MIKPKIKLPKGRDLDKFAAKARAWVTSPAGRAAIKRVAAESRLIVKRLSRARLADRCWLHRPVGWYFFRDFSR